MQTCLRKIITQYIHVSNTRQFKWGEKELVLTLHYFWRRVTWLSGMPAHVVFVLYIVFKDKKFPTSTVGYLCMLYGNQGTDVKNSQLKVNT